MLKWKWRKLSRGAWLLDCTTKKRSIQSSRKRFRNLKSLPGKGMSLPSCCRLLKNNLTPQGNGCKLYHMDTTSIRVRLTTHENLRRIYGITGERTQPLLERLVTLELERVQMEETKKSSRIEIKLCDCGNP